MSTIAGVWTETVLQNIRLRADQIGFSDRIDLNLKPRIDLLPAMNAIQTATVAPLNTGRKNYTVEVSWMNNCEIIADTCTTCDNADAPELSTNALTYTLDKCKESRFKVVEANFWDNDYMMEEAMAKGMLSVEKVLIEEVLQDFITVVSTSGGTNQMNLASDAGIATVFPNETRIAPVNYTIDRMSYFARAAQYNRFGSPVMLSGQLLYDNYFNSNYQAGSFIDNGNSNRWGVFPFYWDVFNFNALGLDAFQYMVNAGTMAFASRGIYPETPDIWDNVSHFSRPSVFMPNLIIDWTQKITCVEDMKSIVVVGKAHWANLVNPVGCEEENTGVLAFHSI